jgi:hypothetical protein
LNRHFLVWSERAARGKGQKDWIAHSTDFPNRLPALSRLQFFADEAKMKNKLCLAVALVLLAVSNLSAATLYVSRACMNPSPPYATWATASTNIQNAVDAALPGALVLVTNGVYPGGLAVDKPLTLVGLNGPQFTVIDGGGVHQCLSMTNGVSLYGFTLTNGWSQNGGGLWCGSTNAFLTNCVIVGNAAAQNGGGAYGATLYNCLLTGNSATNGVGGGAYSSMLYNCTVTGNSANSGGGASGGILYNSIIYFNTAPNGSNYLGVYYLMSCCTTPAPSFGSGNITSAPLFLDYPSGNLRLQSTSPCINAGNNAFVYGTTDLDGNQRISAGTVDMGAYEFQASGAPFIILQPLSQTVSAGTNVTFTVGAAGSVPFYWQWRLNGTAISGATDSSLTLTAVTTNQAGLYSVIVRNALGSVTSVDASLTFWPLLTSYVWQNSPSPTPPYGSWVTAAHAIQDAVDVAAPGLVVLVTNGTYTTGGRTAGGLLANRVAVDKPLTLRSVNGPQVTVIEGFQEPGTINGFNAIRCVSLADGATLSGFTLTNGATSQRWGGADQTGGGAWCQSTNAMITNCIIAGNSAAYAGGGVYGGTLNDCTLIGNVARGDNGSANSAGGGANSATLIHCTLTGNSAEGQYGCGGGAALSTLFKCTINNNSSVDNGGGVYYGCTLTNCVLTGNSTGGYGGGAEGENSGPCSLYSCVLAGNTAGGGGGAVGCRLYNCTLTGNSVDYLAVNGPAYSGGGVGFCSLLNCIVYYNTAVWGDANYDPSSTFSNCCTTPLPPAGSGNITLEPQLATTSHLSANSPCRGAGLAAGTTGTDIDGEPWANPPSMGCDEYYAGAVTGPLNVAIVAAFTNVAVGSQVPFTAVIDGRASASVWDFGDGVIVSNRPYASHAWTVPGDYVVVLRAYNDSQPAGVAAVVALHVPTKLMHYVAALSTNPVPPFTSWTTAATNIQDAVDTATAGDEILVADGVYATGGRAVGTNPLVNRVAVTNLLSLRSLNGPQSTFIQGAQAPGGGNGDGAIRCVYLANGASLFGFTLTNGATRTAGDVEAEQGGGGVWCESTGAMLSNCVVVANYGVYGGGASRGTLYNCLLASNSTSGNVYGGGGSYQSTLYNCTLTGNSADFFAGGGVAAGTLFNCIVYDNTSLLGNYWHSTMNYCCTTPMPTNGVGNITNTPLFVSQADGNFHLQVGSPCIDSGNNAFVSGTTDLDGNPRLFGGTVDMGAYEFQSPVGPLINVQPLSQAVYAGGNVTFTVGVRGSLPLSWQWLFNGTVVSTATSSSLTLVAVTPDRAGGYSVVVTNNLGSVTSQVAVLTVEGAAPLITQEPLSQTVYAGSNVIFTVAAASSLLLSWQWQLNGTAIPGATDSSLALLAVTTNQVGGYSAVVTNTLGSVTSQVAILTVLDTAPVITLQPLSQTVSFGSNVNFTVGATGSVPLFWQWLFNATAIPNATNSSLTLPSVTTGQAGVYSVIVSNRLGSVASADAILTVMPPLTSYVWADSPNPTPPYTNWATAARFIQDAVDAASAGGEIVVTNGIYATGGRTVGTSALTNRVVVDKSLTVRSVNGPEATIIQGYQVPGVTNGDAAIRCVYLSSNSVLSGFTLTNGATRQTGQSDPEVSGGGAYCDSWRSALVANCKVIGNSAAQSGGGAYICSLDNCLLTGNSAGNYGGGSFLCALTNCTVTGNSASQGGGDYVGILFNSIIYYNNAPGSWDGNCYLSWGSMITFSCTTPAPPTFFGPNIDAEPLFVDQANGDFHLQATSPCINAGNNAFVSGTTDLDGNPRIVGGTVDMGTYEFQAPGSLISYAWLRQYSLPTDGSADFIDTDGDGMNNWQEWICHTDPTDAQSVLRLLSATPSSTNVTVSWQSVSGVTYFLERSANLESPFTLEITNIIGVVTNIVLIGTNSVVVSTNIIGLTGTTTYADTNATGPGPFYYRVGVQGP